MGKQTVSGGKPLSNPGSPPPYIGNPRPSSGNARTVAILQISIQVLPSRFPVLGKGLPSSEIGTKTPEGRTSSYQVIDGHVTVTGCPAGLALAPHRASYSKDALKARDGRWRPSRRVHVSCQPCDDCKCKALVCKISSLRSADCDRHRRVVLAVESSICHGQLRRVRLAVADDGPPPARRCAGRSRELG